jgi:hypothetical protein
VNGSSLAAALILKDQTAIAFCVLSSTMQE